MGLFASLVLVISLLHLGLLRKGSSSALTLDSEHQSCVSVEDPRLQTTCEVGHRFSRGYTCLVTPGLLCQGALHVGEGSLCVRDDDKTFSRCSKGQWVDSYKLDDKMPRKTRVKRGFFRRVGRFFRRVGRFVGNVVRGAGSFLCNIFTFGRCNPRVVVVINKRPFFTFCPYVRPQIADSGKLSKRVSWPTPRASDPEGERPSITTAGSLTSGSEFWEGTTSVLYRARDSHGGVGICIVTVRVTVTTCRSGYRPLAHGRQTCTGPRYNIWGSVCSHSCDRGYELQGSTSVTCQSNGLWSASFPSCHPVSCGAPGNITGGELLCPFGLTFRKICLVRCRSGFVPSGATYAVCQASKDWSTIGHCKDVEPPRFVNTPCHDNVEVYAARLGLPTFVTFTQPPVTDNAQGHVTLTSDVTSGSSFPAGVRRVTFKATDEQGNSRNCSFTVTVTSQVCKKPDLELANRTRTLMLYNCPDGHDYGATCTLSCKHGFPLRGASNITCERDNSTHPPTMEWLWPDPHLGKPECKENNCSALDAPLNGAMACYLGDYGWDCLMSCNKDWEVTASTDGHFLCTNSAGYWVPSEVPDCLKRIRPGHVHMASDVFYYTDSCNISSDTLRQNFISRISNSSWKDACIGVPSCVWQNVQVYCGSTSGRKKRETGQASDLYHAFILRTKRNLIRVKRQPTSYVAIEFEISIEYKDVNETKEQTYQHYMGIILAMYKTLQAEADAGYFNLQGLTTDGSSVGYPVVSADCPLGTLFKATASTTSFSCVGCYRGHYLPPASSRCVDCARGQYTEKDNATSCDLCPQGWSTPSTGSTHRSQCKQLCPAGSVSTDGFMPCQACPPGEYQSQQGATHCLRCPAGTWTISSNATGLDQCKDADVRLTSNRSLSVEVAGLSGASSSLSARLWLLMGVNSRFHISVREATASSSVTLGLVLYTNGADVASLPGPPVVSLAVDSDSWTNFLLNLDPQNTKGDMSIYRQGTEVLSTSLGLTLNQPFTLKVTAQNGEVLVSGLRADAKSLSQAEITDALTKCTGEKSSNLMSWLPSPSSVFLPSTCDGDDGFSSWSAFGPCSAPCGGGERTRQRQCNNPTPQNNGSPCVGQSMEREACNTHDCPVAGGWGSWSSWGPCSATCGSGQRSRTRSCDSPVPSGGQPCVGPDVETEACRLQRCPECSPLGRPYGGVLTCEEETSPFYLKTCILSCRAGFVAAFSFPNYTCGEETGFLWNHERDHESKNAKLPACSLPSTVKNVVIQRASLHNVSCKSGTDDAFKQRLQKNLHTSLPCAKANCCTVQATTDCYEEDAKRRRRRSADNQMMTFVEVSMDFGDSKAIDTEDSSAMADYERLLSIAQSTYLLMTDDDSNSALFSVTVNGQRIISTNVSHHAYTTCPSGYTSLGEVCVECPVGSKEEEGQCLPCPLGTYQDQAASTSCKPCPRGLSWDVLGASDISQCILPFTFDHDDDDGDSVDHLPIIVGTVCGGTALIAIIAGLIICRLKTSPPPGRTFSLRPASAQSTVYPVNVSPLADWQKAHQESSHITSPSSLQLTTQDTARSSPPPTYSGQDSLGSASSHITPTDFPQPLPPLPPLSSSLEKSGHGED